METERRQTRGVPVRALRVEVREGPDAGAAVEDDEAVSIGTAAGADLRLTDRTVSRYHAELEVVAGGVRVRDLSSTNGTRVAGVRIVEAIVPPGSVLALGDTRVQVSDGEVRERELLAGDALGGLRGATPGMRALMAKVRKVAASDVGVLITGESGTGKELAARALHEEGARAAGPFVTVDCGALSPTLVASELFGHERGAFTGADRRRVGAFEQAHGGTLFLDEVGELPEALQSTLLGVLERRRFRRLGGGDDVDVDVRVVSATHRDLRADVNEGRFRLDLYYRLAVVRLGMPPLRERLDDLPILLTRFLEEAGFDEPLEAMIGAPTMEMLRAHRWPGNVRELRNWVEAAVAIGEAPELDAGLDGGSGASDPIGALLERPYKDARGALLSEFERRYLARLLERAEGNQSQAARLAEMNRSHLIDLLRRHDLK